MAKLKHYQELIVWQKSMDLVQHVYEVTSAFPKHELYGLTSQIRRAAVSIPSNIAEGQARNTTGEFKYQLGVAKGSLAELETEIILSCRLGYLQSEATILNECAEVGRMLNGLLNSLK
jgi:four helix bundle protein